MDKKICVIGGEGFIGSHLVDRFNAISIDDRSMPKHNFLHTHKLDITMEPIDDIFTDCDLVIHCACSDIRKSITEPERDCLVNALGTLNVLKSCRKLRKSILYISSVSVHSEKSHYAISKFAGEKYTLMYRQWIDTCVIRLSNVFGERDTESVVAKWLTEDKIKLIDADATRDFLYIKDAVVAVEKAIEFFPQKVIDIGTGVETSLGKLALWISSKKNVPIVSESEREIDNVKRRVVDFTQAVKLINFTAKYTVYQGLNNMGLK